MTGFIRSSTLQRSRGPRSWHRAKIVPRHSYFRRHGSDSTLPPNHHTGDKANPEPTQRDAGAMTRRLAQMSEENVEQGGKGARKAVEEAGFSEDLRRRLEEKIADATFRSDNASALAQAELPASASKDTKYIAAARPWSGTESVQDASLRMLTDAYKPLRGKARPALSVRGPPAKIDTGRPSVKLNTGARLASARDRTSIYAFSKDASLSEEEREKFRAQMKARFQPGARSLPATLQGLASLANERIEDAIARGQFKNLPRGQKIERDHNANSPFINTTEYFMNKMIQRQDIVPPWIEKQQEVVSMATKFRTRLRVDWKRHVARSIASRGGSLEEQMKLAEEHAFAESLENPSRKRFEQDSNSNLSSISMAGELRPNEEQDDATAMEEEVRLLERTFNDDGTLRPTEERDASSAGSALVHQAPPPEPPRRPLVPPFRDPQWEQAELSYHTLAIENLNSLTRSYNLMAPNLAKKPYFSLARELRSCFAEVAPQVAGAIRERALRPKVKGLHSEGHTPGGVLEKFAMSKAEHVYDERRPQYGFREFWKDLFSSSKRSQ